MGYLPLILAFSDGTTFAPTADFSASYCEYGYWDSTSGFHPATSGKTWSVAPGFTPKLSTTNDALSLSFQTVPDSTWTTSGTATLAVRINVKDKVTGTQHDPVIRQPVHIVQSPLPCPC
jgi:hypothetical protein